jgi:hypothetical protein
MVDKEGGGIKDYAYMLSLPTRFDRTSFISAYSMVIGDNDIQAIISGVAGWGKSTLGIRYAININKYLRNYFDIDVPRFSIKEDIIYSPERSDFNEILRMDKYNTMVVDEGYLAALNLESNRDSVIQLVKILNATRSKNNAMIFCFQNIKRATKGLMERFNIWMHKPSKNYAILLARSNIFTTDDPWGLDNLLKARTPSQINFFLNINANKMTHFRTKKLKPKQWILYNKLKTEGHHRTASKNELKEDMIRTHSDMMEKVYEIVEKKKQINPIDLNTWLRKKIPNFTENQVKKFIKEYTDFSIHKKEKELKGTNWWESNETT